MTGMHGPDLHLHSTASDGALSPTELVEAAARLRIPAIALTDHDSVSGVAEALDAAADTSVTVIPGVELSSGKDGRGIHILGYHVDHTDTELLSRLAGLREKRVLRAERIVAALLEDGYDLTLAEVMARANGGAVGRAHIAQLLVDAGHAASTDDAFLRFLGRSTPYYVPKPVSPPEEVIGWIRAAGGVAVLAHPGLSEVDDLIGELVSAGIVGIEAYHGSHDRHSRERYAHIAASYGLVATGGSDFHGDEREGVAIGTVAVPDNVVAALDRARSLGPQ
ncbi:MAG: PHP domain-containing protein [Coriobacteriia bacterium]|nr:PHP domain-containing protein [Coriobacteriia bacterium]